MIIEILQKELLTSSTTRDNNLATTEGFTVFKQRRKNTSLTGTNDKVRARHQFQPIPVAVNRYDTLDNLQKHQKSPITSTNLVK